jgi:hypothetical protein
VYRRQYLAATAGVAGTSLAGCTAFTDETVLETPTEQHDGQSVYYRYEHGDEEILRVSFNTQPETDTIQHLRAYIEQPGDTTLDDYRFRFTPDTTGEVSADIYLHPPRLGHSDEFDTYRDADWTVVSGEYEDDRRVTTRFDVLVFGDVQSDAGLPPLLIDYEVMLSGDGVLGDTFIARDQQTMKF